MLPCNSKKTGYTSYKTLSHVIKCIFLMCAFLFIGLFNANDKVEAASISYYGIGDYWGSTGSYYKADRYFKKGSDTEIQQYRIFRNWESPYYVYDIATYKFSADKKINKLTFTVADTGATIFSWTPDSSYASGYITFHLASYSDPDFDTNGDGYATTTMRWTSDTGDQPWCSTYSGGINFICGISIVDDIISSTSGITIKMDYTYVGQDCFIICWDVDKTSSISKTIKITDKAPLGSYDFYYNTYNSTVQSEGWSTYDVPSPNEYYNSSKGYYYVGSGDNTINFSGFFADTHYSGSYYCISTSTSCSSWTAISNPSYYSSFENVTYAWSGTSSTTIYIHGKDKYGNLTYNSYNFPYTIVRDTVNPVLSSLSVTCTLADGTSHTCSSWTNQNVTLTVSGATDAGAGFYAYGSTPTYQYSLDGGTTWKSDWKSSSTSQAVLEFTTEANHSIKFKVCDAVNNCATSSAYSVKIDKTAPTISAFTLTGNSSAMAGYSNQGTLSAKVSGTDNLSGISSYSISGNCTTKTGTFTTSTSITNASISSISMTTSSQGEKTMYIYVYDAAGNVSEDAIYSIVYDNVKPTISTFTATGNSAASATYTNQTNLTYSITASDTTAQIRYYEVKDGSTVINSQSTSKPSSGTLASTTKGAHTLTLTVTDRAGNAQTKTYSITYDPADTCVGTANCDDLKILLFEAIGNATASLGYTNTTSITYNITATDTTSGVRDYTVTDGGTTIYNKSTTKPTSDILANTNQGTHQLTLTVTDYAGNSESLLFLLTYDTSAPTASKFNVIGNSAATAGYTNTRNVTFEIASDFETTAQREFYVYDGSTAIATSIAESIGTPPSIPTSGILATTTQGTHTLKLKIIDFAGNVFETTTSTTVKPFNIILDTTAPVISSFTYTGNANAMSGYTNQQAISYTLNVTDTYFKSGSVTPHNTSGTACSANAKSVTSKSSSGSINLCDTTNGTHQLIVSAVDHAGNAASAATSYNIIMDTVAPVLDLTTTLSPSLPAKNGTATITYTEKYPRVTMTGQTLRYVLATDATSSANMTCTVVTSTTLTQTNCFGSSALTNTSTDVYSITITLSPTTSGTYYLRVVDENLAMDRAGNAATSPVSKVNMIVNEETVSTYVFGGYLIDQTAPTVSLSLGNGSYNGSGTSTIHYSKTGASITVTFSDNMYLWNYSSGAYYRYCWSTTTSCTSWTSISGTRTKTQVSGTITVPSTIGTHYLIFEGDVKDYAGWYPTNSYLYTSRTKTASGTRVFKFVTDNTAGTLTIGHTKVLGGDNKYTYYAKPGIAASVNYTDNTALRKYNGGASYHSYAWSTSVGAITGWNTTRMITTMPTATATRVGGFTTPTTEGVWYLMLYSPSTDAAGNSISAPATYTTVSVDGYMWPLKVTVKVYKFIIDGTSPELVLKSESGENTYYKTEFDENDEPINPITELKVGDTVSIGYEEAHGYSASNDAVIYYYISTEKDADNKVNFANAISNGLAGLVDDNHKITFASNVIIMNNPEGYYLYLYIQVGESTYVKYGYDYAGNELSSNYDGCVSIYGDDYLVVKFFIEPIELESDEEDEAITNIKDNVKDVITSPSDYGFIDNSAYIVIAQDGVMTNIKNNINKIVTNLRDYQTYIVVDETTGNIESAFLQESTTGNALQVQKDTNNENNYIWIYTINNVVRNPADAVSINGAIVPEIIAKFKIPFGIQKVLSAYDSNDTIIDSSKIYPEISIILDNGSPINVTLVIFNNSFIAVKNDNTATNIVVNQGEEIANVGMSFNSKDGSEVSVDTLITLDGVKVKNVDTNIPGVYNVTQVAKDKLGRTTRVNKEIVVLANKEVKEEVVEEEIIEVVEEVVVLPIEVKVNNEKVEEVKVVEVEQNRVEVKLENKVKVNGYKKRKEIRKNKKEQFSFKLFSKYFFKVYDG